MKRFKILLLLLSILFISGCFKRDDMDNINIITTTYPITYITDKLYAENSTITSIYPNGINIDEYEITDKQISEYAKSELFIYNGQSKKEKEIATRLLNKNKNIKLIDATQGIDTVTSIEELWLNPSNYLMIAQNIKDHLSDFITSVVIKDDIAKRYEKIKLIISKYDANFKIIAENAIYKDVIIGNESLKFLDKYGFDTLILEDNENLLKTDVTTAKNNVGTKINSNIFIIDNYSNDYIKDVVNTGATLINIKSMTILSVEDVKNKETYETIMNEFIDHLREEAYS